MFLCKVCLLEFSTLEDHVNHFELLHRATINSLFQCGVSDCSVRLKDLKKYRSHINEFHTNSDSPSEDTLVFYKCAYPDCNFKSKSKGSFRNHRFWNHPNGRENCGALEESSTSECEAVDDDPPCSVSPIGFCEEHSQSSAYTAERNENLFLKKFVHLGMLLTSKYHVPDTTLAYILQSYRLLLKESGKVSSETLRCELSALGLDNETIQSIQKKVVDESPLTKLHACTGPMRSYHMRKKQYATLFPFLPPTQRDLGLNGFNEISYCHYVSLKESLHMLFNDDSVYEQYLQRQSRPPVLSEDLTDITSGTAFQDHALFANDPSALQLIVYQDDFEICNAIGPAGGTYKITHMSYTLGNLHPWNRSKVDPLQLMMLCKEKDVEYFGFECILEPIISELKELETEGVQIRGQNVKASVLVLLGDNLGTHSICGFSEGFARAKYFCRYCEESREDWLQRWYPEEETVEDDYEEIGSDSNDSEEEQEEDDEVEDNEGASQLVDGSDDSSGDSDEEAGEGSAHSDVPPFDDQIPRSKAPLRSVDSYQKCVDQLETHPAGVKGIVGRAEFNKLKYYHIVNGTPPCLPHDLFEGVVAFDLIFCLKKLKVQYKFSWDWLNRRIKYFKFLGTDKLDKPPAKFSNDRKKVKGSAIQIWVFLRFISLLIGDKITDKSDPAWTMVLTLSDILQLLTSPVISKSVLPHVSTLIRKYLYLRASLFKVPLRPKHHFF